MRVDTINVVEESEGELLGIRSYSNDKTGRGEAKEMFKAIARENGATTDEEIKDALFQGHYEEGTYNLFLLSSS